MAFTYNRVIHRFDYQLFGVTYRKAWEIKLALKTLRELGAAHPTAKILGAGAGMERTIYELANERDCAEVHPTDLYYSMGVWGDFDGNEFLRNPSAFAPTGVTFDSTRIKPRHADMCAFPFADNTFDGVFSSGSIEHVGTNGTPNYEAIAQAAQELGRVVKPGGIISLSTEWKLAGDGWGFDNVVLFDEETLMQYVVEPSGCALVDEPDFTLDCDLSDACLLSARVAGYMPPIEHILSAGQFLFTSVHVALRRPS